MYVIDKQGYIALHCHGATFTYKSLYNKIEHGNEKCVKKTTFRTKSEKQSKATNGIRHSKKIPHPKADFS